MVDTATGNSAGRDAPAEAVQLIVNVPRDLYRKLELEAEERSVSIAKLMTDLAGGWFRAHHPR